MNRRENLGRFTQVHAGVSVDDLIEESGVPHSTIYRWWQDNPQRVELMIDGIKYRKSLIRTFITGRQDRPLKIEQEEI